MEELSNKNRKFIVPALLVLVVTLGLLYFWERKNNYDNLAIAKQNAFISDSLVKVYTQLDQQLFDVIAVHDSTLKKPNTPQEITSILTKVLAGYEAKNVELFGQNQREKNTIYSLEISNDTLQRKVQTLGEKIIDVERKEKSAADRLSSLTTRLSTEKAAFDSIAQAFEKQLFIANKSIPDSLNIVSPQGVKLFYYGKIKEDSPSGFGIGFYAGQGYYIGEWKSNARSGYGKHFYKDGSTYQGNFKDDLREGYGIYRYPTGQIYQGSWQDNLMNGPGELIEANGQTLRGTWENGKFLRK